MPGDWVEAYIGTSSFGEGETQRAVVAVVYVLPDGLSTYDLRTTTQPTTNPQAVALGVLAALKRAEGRPVVLWSNLQNVVVSRSRPRREPWPDDPPRAFSRLMWRASAAVALTGSEVRWLPDAASNRHFTDAKNLAAQEALRQTLHDSWKVQ